MLPLILEKGMDKLSPNLEGLVQDIAVFVAGFTKGTRARQRENQRQIQRGAETTVCSSILKQAI